MTFNNDKAIFFIWEYKHILYEWVIHISQSSRHKNVNKILNMKKKNKSICVGFFFSKKPWTLYKNLIIWQLYHLILILTLKFKAIKPMLITSSDMTRSSIFSREMTVVCRRVRVMIACSPKLSPRLRKMTVLLVLVFESRKDTTATKNHTQV